MSYISNKLIYYFYYLEGGNHWKIKIISLGERERAQGWEHQWWRDHESSVGAQGSPAGRLHSNQLHQGPMSWFLGEKMRKLWNSGSPQGWHTEGRVSKGVNPESELRGKVCWQVATRRFLRGPEWEPAWEVLCGHRSVSHTWRQGSHWPLLLWISLEVEPGEPWVPQLERADRVLSQVETQSCPCLKTK